MHVPVYGTREGGLPIGWEDEPRRETDAPGGRRPRSHEGRAGVPRAHPLGVGVPPGGGAHARKRRGGRRARPHPRAGRRGRRTGDRGGTARAARRPRPPPGGSRPADRPPVRPPRRPARGLAGRLALRALRTRRTRRTALRQGNRRRQGRDHGPSRGLGGARRRVRPGSHPVRRGRGRGGLADLQGLPRRLRGPARGRRDRRGRLQQLEGRRPLADHVAARSGHGRIHRAHAGPRPALGDVRRAGPRRCHVRRAARRHAPRRRRGGRRPRAGVLRRRDGRIRRGGPARRHGPARRRPADRPRIDRLAPVDPAVADGHRNGRDEHG